MLDAFVKEKERIENTMNLGKLKILELLIINHPEYKKYTGNQLRIIDQKQSYDENLVNTVNWYYDQLTGKDNKGHPQLLTEEDQVKDVLP